MSHTISTDIVDRIVALESGQADHAEAIRTMQLLINSGTAWRLQGAYGRAAMQALESGDCMLGKVYRLDYYGNRIPSRDEVQAGTKGSYALVEQVHGKAYADMLAELE